MLTSMRSFRTGVGASTLLSAILNSALESFLTVGLPLVAMRRGDQAVRI